MRKVWVSVLSLSCVAAVLYSSMPLTPLAAGQKILGAEDCLPYNRDSLRIVDLGATGWQLTELAGPSRVHTMFLLDTKADAEQALALAKAHSAVCFIGRENRRARTDRARYIVEYWK